MPQLTGMLSQLFCSLRLPNLFAITSNMPQLSAGLEAPIVCRIVHRMTRCVRNETKVSQSATLQYINPLCTSPSQLPVFTPTAPTCTADACEAEEFVGWLLSILSERYFHTFNC